MTMDVIYVASDIDHHLDLTRAWGRVQRKAGVAAMSETKTGGEARRMLTMDQVLELVPVGKSTLKRMIKSKDFPSAHYITPNKPIWYEDEIVDWQETLPARSPRKRAKTAQGSSGEAR
ncbi:helix-turn-helix transcriptional regulator [Bradyrhizobium cytisi]|uniref:AlpA family phage regulatory protein n=1 Tax=Bradyrhizobium cytisi TaxID=515489 RepID=A0A5S4X0H0_9BRAD|nr:AlpA family phage regulatory protein [Bradyrhizobium cytisi]TYL87382.1 AlpA family phage regulatory protein [Bradyrhizobium cytisi]